MKKIKRLGLDFQKKTITELSNNQLQRINGGTVYVVSGPITMLWPSVSGPAGNYSSNCE